MRTGKRMPQKRTRPQPPSHKTPCVSREVTVSAHKPTLQTSPLYAHEDPQKRAPNCLTSCMCECACRAICARFFLRDHHSPKLRPSPLFFAVLVALTSYALTHHTITKTQPTACPCHDSTRLCDGLRVRLPHNMRCFLPQGRPQGHAAVIAARDKVRGGDEGTRLHAGAARGSEHQLGLLRDLYSAKGREHEYE